VPRPTAAEQAAVWHGLLDGRSADAGPLAEALTDQFDLGATAISEVVAGVDPDVDLGTESGELWRAARARARGRLGHLAERVEPSASWEQLVLPAPSAELLRMLGDEVRHRGTVLRDWAMSGPGRRGAGTSALFAGPSGTGKTMAAEVLAAELDVDLYRVDLAGVVSKYIGETEKNLRRVFDAAEESGAVLFFDEADALFGKRSEVKDSHDRYANVEVSYLLQRMESYRGLAILASNLKGSIDPAFLRRIRYVVNFPVPAPEARIRLWQQAFPPATPTLGLVPERLAQLPVTGGNIRGIALTAAYLAAADGGVITMDCLLRAARTEFAKLERPLSDAEVRGWEVSAAVASSCVGPGRPPPTGDTHDR
jgi:hypothetical protein